MSHECHAHGCSKQVPPRMFMCPRHWFSLPKKIQSAIWREYRPGQENDKSPSLSYLSVQQFAIGIAAFKPNNEEAALICAEYLFKAEAYRVRAMKSGAVDPLAGLTPIES